MVKKSNVKFEKTVYICLVILVFWYFFFASSITLRPYAQLFWGGLAVVGTFFACVSNYALDKVDAIYFSGMVFFFLVALLSDYSKASILEVINYVIYYIVARFVVKLCDLETIVNIIFAFSIIHLICLFIQLLFPEIYLSVLLPLLPKEKHTEILEQMEYNSSYYGFSIQTSMIAMYLSFGAIISAIKIFYTKYKKIIFIILMVLFIIAIFFTKRRGPAVITLAIILLIYCKSKSQDTTKFLIGVAVVLFIAAIGIENIPGLNGIINKFLSLGGDNNILNGRDSVIIKGFNAFIKNPIIGTGLGTAHLATGDDWMENAYIVALIEGGIIGVIVFFAPFVIMFKELTGTRKNKNEINFYNDFALYMFLLYVFMSLVENYLAEPATLFILFVVFFILKKSELECKDNITVNTNGYIKFKK